MNKFIGLLFLVFLAFTTSSFSQDKNHKPVQSAKTEQTKHGKSKAGVKPKKARPSKKTNKPRQKPHTPKKKASVVRV
jgi:hypothetical protein